MSKIHLTTKGQPMNSKTTGPNPPTENNDKNDDPPKTLKDKIIDAIREVYDPEIPTNVYELGLIYDIDVNDEGKVQIKMTLTSPACPSAQELPLEVRSHVGRVPQVTDVEVDIIFDPPWNPDMMSPIAKVQLGMF